MTQCGHQSAASKELNEVRVDVKRPLSTNDRRAGRDGHESRHQAGDMKIRCLPLLLLAFVLTSQAPRLSAAMETVRVPMQDGVKLATDVHLPAGN